MPRGSIGSEGSYSYSYSYSYDSERSHSRGPIPSKHIVKRQVKFFEQGPRGIEDHKYVDSEGTIVDRRRRVNIPLKERRSECVYRTKAGVMLVATKVELVCSQGRLFHSELIKIRPIFPSQHDSVSQTSSIDS